MEEFSKRLQKNLMQLFRINHRMMYQRRQKSFYRGQYSVLILLKKEGSLSASQISEHLDIRPSSSFELIKKLEKDDLVKKEKDQKDKRVTWISLTKKGKEYLENNFKSKRTEDFFDKYLNKEEQEELNHLLEKLLNGINEDRKEMEEKCGNKFRRGGFFR